MTTKKESSAIPIVNAGLALLDGYYTSLFERMGLLREGSFAPGVDSRRQAAMALHYIATGNAEAAPEALLLNNVLCGIDPTDARESTIILSEEQRAQADAVVDAAQKRWPASGERSTDGFRASWLQRSGVLTEGPERWELTVEQQPQDRLIARSPLSFSIVHFPWMKNPLIVRWGS
ncbi:MAG: hypothetical protein EOP50_19895 [Sphingobacteriales bacterium]|nr:MAG: hypothetical protein EOP50_19895 [Sphingobacteriales bacterium]